MRDAEKYIGECKGNLVIFDGSLLAFRASAAGEKRDIEVTHRDSGKMMVFDNRTAFKAYIKAKNAAYKKKRIEITDFDLVDRQHPLELKQTLHILKQIIAGVLSLCAADDYLIVLDDPSPTFRHELATVQEYKGNRKGKIKPVNLQAVKDHMILYYNTEVASKGIEADDVLNFYAYLGYKLTKSGDKRKVIPATFDKDQFGNSGWIIDFRKDGEGNPLMKEPHFIDGYGTINCDGKDIKGEGRKFFYSQWVNQDKADNYKASKLSKKAFGDKTAFKMLKDCNTDKECVQTIVDKFKEWYPEPVKYTSWDGKDMERTWLEISQEYFDLARMLRWEGDHVKVEDFLDKLGVVY